MTLLPPLLLLLGALFLSICNTALLHLGRYQAKELLRKSRPPFLFSKKLLNACLERSHFLYLSISFARQIYLLAYAIAAFRHFVEFFTWPFAALATILIALFLDFAVRLAATMKSRLLFQLASPVASLFFWPLFPFLGLLLSLTRHLWQEIHSEDEGTLKSMIRESELQHHLDITDQKLITSFVNFKERVAKEIMVPRVDLFSLPAEMSIRDATLQLAKESFSRIPIYKENLDHIVGVVLYKDLLTYYANPMQNLDAPLETLVKPVLYAPENKKIAHLLQEFRTKQIHMAIIVDEYGGTEGIVTTEDILEELVGEIEDEYDIGGEQFWPLPTGGWIVDGKMSINDIRDELGIQIPDSPEYETIGGYISQKAGTIPAKGWRLLHDAFELEVLSASERSINKIKIIPYRIEP